MIGSLALQHELGHWRRAHRRVRLWWRDDDARFETPALLDLLRLARFHRVPLTLAVIPDGKPHEVASATSTIAGVSIAQHGATHANRAPMEAAPSEHLANDTVDALSALIAEGAKKLDGIDNRIPFFVPPWNRTHPPLLQALAQLGIPWMSGFGSLRQISDGVARLDAHVDLLRWKDGPRFRGSSRFLLRLARQARERRMLSAWDDPIGILTHHLDHDV